MPLRKSEQFAILVPKSDTLYLNVRFPEMLRIPVAGDSRETLGPMTSGPMTKYRVVEFPVSRSSDVSVQLTCQSIMVFEKSLTLKERFTMRLGERFVCEMVPLTIRVQLAMGRVSLTVKLKETLLLTC